MAQGRDSIVMGLGAAVGAASVVSGEVAATNDEQGRRSRLPDFQQAIVVAEELPEMPAVVIEGVLLETHKMLLTGPSKAGKTWCLINLAVSVATGSWWVDFRCAQRKVLFVDLETDPRTLQKRVARVSAAKGADAAVVRENLTLWPLRGQSCGLDEIAAELFCRCRKGDFGMVIIDPAYMVQDGDENNAKDIREFFARLDEICVRLECTVVISHHHSKGAQGLKSAIDRGSGSGVFGRAPDAVLDMTELVLEASTLEMARESNVLREVRHLTGWRMSFTLREFAHRDPLDLWLAFPLHMTDHTGLLADCKPNYGGVSEARKVKQEAENLGKVSALDAVCERMIGSGESCMREEVREALHWSVPTIRNWLKESSRFMGVIDQATGRSMVVRRPREDGATLGPTGGGAASAPTADDGSTSGPSDGAAGKGEGVQGELPIA